MISSNDNHCDSPKLGSSQSGLREYNEKLVLSIIRTHGPQAKTDVARRTGLSAQSVSVIMRELEADGLLEKMSPQRGKVGQPSVPLFINPKGAYFFGVKIGRRAAEVLFTDFLGTILARDSISFPYPDFETVFEFALSQIQTMRYEASDEIRAKISGFGVAMPFDIWKWAEIINVDGKLMDPWKKLDIVKELEAVLKIEGFLQNDATAACGAELAFGTAHRPSNFLYIYIAYLVGGGVILNDRLFPGPFGYAGTIGSIPVINSNGDKVQLHKTSAIAMLEHRMKTLELDTSELWDNPGGWRLPDQPYYGWIEESAFGLAQAILSSVAIIDFEAIVIDGWMPTYARADLVKKTRDAFETLDCSGLRPPEIMEGTVGVEARSLGAASVPLSKRYMII